MKILASTIFMFISAISWASPRVDADLSIFDKKVAQMRADFAKIPVDPLSVEWVKSDITHMRDIDQYMRAYWSTPAEKKYSKQEEEYFFAEFIKRNDQIDSINTTEMKGLLGIYSWFYISTFGEKTDQDAWLLVQHADLDPTFQREVLVRLEEALKLKETRPAHYAYLFDRIAAAWYDPARRTLQRYGTQGLCESKGLWVPIPMEDPARIDQRRSAVGLGPLSEYVAMMNKFCS